MSQSRELASQLLFSPGRPLQFSSPRHIFSRYALITLSYLFNARHRKDRKCYIFKKLFYKNLYLPDILRTLCCNIRKIVEE